MTGGKNVGKWLMAAGVDEYWMPFVVGAIFTMPMAIFVTMLANLPPPSAEDIAARTKREPMDGPARKAWFDVKAEDGTVTREEQAFDMIHVCPPQSALDFVAKSPLANEAGWVDVNAETLQHQKFGNIFSLGDAGSTPNAKTAAAVRKQAPVAAHNVVCVLDGKAPTAVYSGYGSCPLTVERGKIVLAEFAYGGKLEPTVPSWMINGTKATRAAWFLKEKMLPNIYFDMMLHGNEMLAKPKVLPHRPAEHEAQAALGDKAA